MSLKRIQSFRAKLVLLVVLSCSATALLIGPTLLIRSYMRSREIAINDMIAHARIIATHSQAAMDFGDAEAAKETLSALRDVDAVAHAALYRKNDDGAIKPLAEYKPRQPNFPEFDPNSPLYETHGRWLVFTTPVVTQEGAVGYLHVLYDLRWIIARIRNSMILTTVLALAATGLALLIALRLQKVLSRPVAALATTARTIASTGDYSVRAPKYGQDELGELTDVFNEMIGQVERQTLEVTAANERFRIAVEAAPNGMIMVDERGRIVMVNTLAESLLGYSREELIGKEVEMLVPPRFRPKHPAQRGGFFAQPQARPMGAGRDLFALRKDGTEVPVEIALSPIKTAERLHVLAAIVDITERRRAESAVRESEARKGAILESAMDCLVTMDERGRIVDFNPAAERTFGYAREYAVGRTVAELLVPPRLRQAHWDGLHRFLETGEAAVLGKRIEMPALRADGSEIPVELAISVVQIPGRMPFFTAYLRDITEQKQQHQERDLLLESERAARTEAERASRMKDEFLATLSHELRTPLTAIMGWAQMIRRGQMPETELDQGLEIIERNARVQTQIIEDLLDMSRIISGKVRLDVQEVELPQVIEAAIGTVQPAAEAKGIRIQKIIDPRVGPVRGDPGRLQQVVWNLVSNAIKFTPRGGRVQIALQRINSHVEINISDTGEGIRPDFLPHVFERFRQADPSTTRRHGGLGLGLAIVKQLVEIHGGRVRAASPGEGQGSTFTVELPLAIVHPLAVAEERFHPRTPRETVTTLHNDDGPISLEGIKVLVVEDEPDARELIARLLEARHATVTRTASAAEALEATTTFKPDVIVSDIGMPVEDGYQFIRKVRGMGDQQLRSTPAIALTAFARSEDRTRALVAGYQMHVAKPVEPTELIACIASLAGRVSGIG